MSIWRVLGSYCASLFFVSEKRLFRVIGAGGSGGLAEAFRVYSGIRKANLKRSASGLRPGAAYLKGYAPCRRPPLTDSTKELPDITSELPDITQTLPAVIQELPYVTQELPDVLQELPDGIRELPDVPRELPDVPQELPDVIPEAPRCHPDIQMLPDLTLGSPWLPKVDISWIRGRSGRFQNLENHTKAYFFHQQSRFRCLVGGCGAEGPIG